ncbi:hypothetical protein [Phenylobacterium sp.]|jgi:hypothetical protein|uniref:hypothetical protein n=1 Tax=Phenylobacterium sp. TaxID=1871053 RepID=UPI002F945FE6
MKPAAALAILLIGLPPTSASAAPQSRGTCLAAPAPLERTAEQSRRHREVWSDSLWLVKQVRARYPDRLAGLYVDTASAEPVRPRLVFRVTGHDPLPPMRLGDRAAGVPVVVEYGAPHSLKQVEAIRLRVAHRLRAMLPDLQGEGYDETTGTIHLDVYAPDRTSLAAAVARCGDLQALYGMPVRIQPLAGRVTLD